MRHPLDLRGWLCGSPAKIELLNTVFPRSRPTSLAVFRLPFVTTQRTQCGAERAGWDGSGAVRRYAAVRRPWSWAELLLYSKGAFPACRTRCGDSGTARSPLGKGGRSRRRLRGRFSMHPRLRGLETSGRTVADRRGRRESSSSRTVDADGDGAVSRRLLAVVADCRPRGPSCRGNLPILAPRVRRCVGR
jgi:hypothetical protein